MPNIAFLYTIYVKYILFLFDIFDIVFYDSNAILFKFCNKVHSIAMLRIAWYTYFILEVDNPLE